MKITDVEAIYLRPPTIEDRTDSSQDALLVRITTDEGLSGIGEVDSCPAVVKAIIEAPKSHTQVHGLRELLIGQDPLDTAVLWRRMYEGTLYYGRSGAVIQAMAGVDLALWDLKGKALRKPVYQLLGGAFQKRLPAYASHMFAFTPEETAALARESVANGFRAVKFGWEPFGRDPALDFAMVRSIRDAVGDSVEVMVDAGLAWDAKTALSRIALLEPFRIFWLEEPLLPDDLRGYRFVTAHSPVKIAAGEQECTVAGFLRLMDEARVDVVQIDVTRVGLTQAVQVAALALERGLRVCNHNFTTGVNTAASLHFLAAAANALYLEYCVEKGELTRHLVKNTPPVIDGMVSVPEGPGLGVEIDWDLVERFAVR